MNSCQIQTYSYSYTQSCTHIVPARLPPFSWSVRAARQPCFTGKLRQIHLPTRATQGIHESRTQPEVIEPGQEEFWPERPPAEVQSSPGTSEAQLVTGSDGYKRQDGVQEGWSKARMLEPCLQQLSQGRDIAAMDLLQELTLDLGVPERETGDALLMVCLLIVCHPTPHKLLVSAGTSI